MNHAAVVTRKFCNAVTKECMTSKVHLACQSVNNVPWRSIAYNARGFSISTQRQLKTYELCLPSLASPQSSIPRFSYPVTRKNGYASQAGPVREKSRQPNNPTDLQRFRPSEIVKIFGQLMDVSAGNKLLKLLQSRRKHGTLDKDIVLPGVSQDTINRGLAFLRQNHPLDEDAAIMRRIEREENEKERAIEAEVQKAEKWSPQTSAAEDGIYGKSKVEEAVRKYNIRMEEQAKERAKREQKELESTQVVFEYRFVAKGGKVMRQIDEVHVVRRGIRIIRTIKNTSYAPRDQDPEEQLQQLSNESSVPGLIHAPNGMAMMQSRNERKKRENPKRQKWREHAQLTNWDGVSEPPYTSWAQRWAIPTLFMLVTLGASLLFARSYQPPPRSARLFPDVPPAASTIMAIIAINVAAFVMWKVPPLWRFMNKHMLVHAVIPKASQLIGNIFSHQRSSHLLINMFMLWWMGTSLCEEVGRGQFLAIYLSGGVFAAWTSLMQALLSKNYLQASLGASGAFCCVVACWLRLREGGRVEWALWPGEWKPSFRSDQFLIILILTDVIGAAYHWRTGAGMIDHVCHLGGFLAGIGWAELLKRQSQTQKMGELRQLR